MGTTLLRVTGVDASENFLVIKKFVEIVTWMIVEHIYNIFDVLTPSGQTHSLEYLNIACTGTFCEKCQFSTKVTVIWKAIVTSRKFSGS